MFNFAKREVMHEYVCSVATSHTTTATGMVTYEIKSYFSRSLNTKVIISVNKARRLQSSRFN